MANGGQQFPSAEAAEGELAETSLKEALALLPRLHHPGVRERQRRALTDAVARAERALTRSGRSGSSADLELKRLLVRAHAAIAEDARHGAGQLSRGSQRAPTEEDCEDGWCRVESIVAVAEASARSAATIASELDEEALRSVAQAGAVSAREARMIVATRNRAYTFHADPSFSFGEGWYLAAAAVLSSVQIQVEPDKPQSRAAEDFLRGAGLSHLLVPYRSRPRANKALPAIVARVFRSDPLSAQRSLRRAFLGEEPVGSEVREWIDERIPPSLAGRKVLVWLRYGTHHPTRNTTYAELCEICRRARRRGLVPVLIGDALRGGGLPEGALDLTLFWKEPLFQGETMRRAQLQLFEWLRQAHALVGQIGVTTAGMDGPALLGLPTVYLTAEPNVRLGKWVGAVPGYEEVVRQGDYWAGVERALSRWAAD